MFADLLHNLTHRHTFASKPGVGQIVLCFRRFSDRTDAHVTALDTCWNFSNIRAHELEPLVKAETEAALAYEARILAMAR